MSLLCAVAILATAAHWHWQAALMDNSHWCFLLCGSVRVSGSGLLRSVLEATGKEL